LDWANLHGIPENKRPNYIKNINKHSRKGTLLLLRTFSIDTDEKYFKSEMHGAKITIYIFNKKDIQNLFPDFNIIKTNISQPKKGGSKPPNIFFLELLLEKI